MSYKRIDSARARPHSKTRGRSRASHPVLPKKAPVQQQVATSRKGERILSRSLIDPKPAEPGSETADTSLPARSTITLKVNGAERRLGVAPWTALLDTLREYLDLTGTKKGCDHGQCGACTVLVDGKRILSCMTLAIMKDGSEVTTIEGLAQCGALHALQEAFIEHDAFQCGYCTPGQICSAVGLIAEGQAKTADDIRELMSGNICRCGAYSNILAAIQQAMRAPKKQEADE